MKTVTGTAAVAAAVTSVIEIGGTHATAANVDLAARTVQPGQCFRAPLSSDAGAEEFLAALVGCASRLPARAESRWAIALPGPFDYERGVGRYQGVGKFDALNGYDLRTALSSRLPGASRISFHNDAEAFLLGEWWAGAAYGHDMATGITLGTGVGSCFLQYGRAVRDGPGVPPEGRVDLLQYEGRPLEESVSRNALRRAYAHAAGLPHAPDVKEIADRARNGDTVAVHVFAKSFHTLGAVLGPYVAKFDPSILVVGGSIAGSWDLVADPLRAGLDTAGADRTALEAALLPETAPLLGAAYLSLDQPRRGRDDAFVP